MNKKSNFKLSYVAAKFRDLETLEPSTHDLSKDEVIAVFASKIKAVGIEEWVATFIEDYTQIKE